MEVAPDVAGDLRHGMEGGADLVRIRFVHAIEIGLDGGLNLLVVAGGRCTHGRLLLSVDKTLSNDLFTPAGSPPTSAKT
jgi:hypothetical protein